MGFFDDALKDAVPGGDLATPIAIAAGALLLHHFMSGGSKPAAPAAPPPNVAPTSGGFLGGGGLLGNLSDAPIQPGQLGGALGQQTISDLAARSGLSEQELLNGLATVLPRLVNNLTPNGRLPTAADMSALGH
jgi:hypothetical protein